MIFMHVKLEIKKIDNKYKFLKKKKKKRAAGLMLLEKKESEGEGGREEEENKRKKKKKKKGEERRGREKSGKKNFLTNLPVNLTHLKFSSIVICQIKSNPNVDPCDYYFSAYPCCT